MKRQFDFIDVPSGPSIPMWLFSPHLPSTSGSIGTGSAPLSSRDATPMHANLTAKPELDGPCDVPSHEAPQPSAPASPTYPLPSPPLPSPPLIPSNRQLPTPPPHPQPLQQPRQNPPNNRHVPNEPGQRAQKVPKQHEDAVPLDQEAQQRPAQQDQQDAGQVGGGAAPFGPAREEGEGFARAED